MDAWILVAIVTLHVGFLLIWHGCLGLAGEVRRAWLSR